MTFNDARAIEQVVWSMRLTDYQRGLNRAKIDNLANGAPPYTLEEEKDNKIEVNVNDLSLTRLSHDARLQLYTAFTKPGNFFTCRTDRGEASRRLARSVTVTTEMNRILKRSDRYFENLRSRFAQMVMHGCGPSVRQNHYEWCPEPVGIEDVMMPSNTRLTFRNLPFFAVFRAFTAYELRELTSGDKVDKGWQMDTVNACIKWAEEETAKLYSGGKWQQYWSPEKAEDRFKQSSGIYASDLVQTIDCWDFYYRHDEGWCRRIIFDAYGGASQWNHPTKGYGKNKTLPDKNLIGGEGQFLYNSGDRVYATDLCNILTFQFADLSSKGPFHYHAVRSLGFLLYAVCHLQNRLRCRFSEAVFETLLNYMRVDSPDDALRALKIELASRGILDSSVKFLRPDERWQPNVQLAELGLSEFKQIISDNSSSYVQNNNLSRDRVEKTKFQVMAEVNAMTTLTSAALQQAYRYECTDHREIVRRFMLKDSQDRDVLEFRRRCIAKRVPEKFLVDPEAWDVESEKVVGGGNKTLEMAIAQQLMEWRAAYAPEGQQEILKIATLAITDDAALADRLVPDPETVSDSKHAAMMGFGTLMVGGQILFPASLNRPDIVEALLAELALGIMTAHKMQNHMATPQEVKGWNNVLQHIAGLIEQIAADKPLKERAKRYAEQSGKLANEVKGFEQRLEQQAKKAQANGGNGDMAKTMAEIESNRAMTAAKIEANRDSRAEKAASRQVEFEQKLQHSDQQHAQDLRHQAADQAVKLAGDRQQLEIDKERAAVAAAAPAGED